MKNVMEKEFTDIRTTINTLVNGKKTILMGLAAIFLRVGRDILGNLSRE